MSAQQQTTILESSRASMEGPTEVAPSSTSQDAAIMEKSGYRADEPSTTGHAGATPVKQPITGLSLILLVTIVTITGFMVLMDMTVLVTVSGSICDKIINTDLAAGCA